MAAGFRSYVWDPSLIISQIAAIQCVFYLFLAFWILLVDFWTGSTRSLDQFFRPKELEFSSFKGKVTMAAFCLNALTGSITTTPTEDGPPVTDHNNICWEIVAGGLWVIVRRAKQCLDFAATAHFIHLIICAIYSGFPSTLTWWLLNITCMALMAVIGEFACMRTELKAIPVSVASVKSTV
ncbi:protein SYS1 homolog isoform X1 [Montipora capricornis]|uniref:protein SYS1 homolog isoform X1 n=1 Tax=Montipora capricornis TaxID=246305 RepID=UPI0035F20347